MKITKIVEIDKDLKFTYPDTENGKLLIELGNSRSEMTRWQILEFKKALEDYLKVTAPIDHGER